MNFYCKILINNETENFYFVGAQMIIPVDAGHGSSLLISLLRTALGDGHNKRGSL